MAAAEHMRPEGLAQGYYCLRCGAAGLNMLGTGHGPDKCEPNPELVNELRRLNEHQHLGRNPVVDYTPPNRNSLHTAIQSILDMGVSDEVVAVMLASAFTILEPEGRFAPSHFKGPLMLARVALAAHRKTTGPEMLNDLVEIWKRAQAAREAQFTSVQGEPICPPATYNKQG